MKTQDRITRPKEAIALTGLSRAQFYRVADTDPTFPPKYRMSQRSIGWRLSELLAWIESRKESARGHR